MHLGGANFLFALMAMLLLEWACRLCKTDSRGRALPAFSQALNSINANYFVTLPGSVQTPRDFALPSIPGMASPPLIWMLYDLLRQGQAHHYQQLVLHLADAHVYVKLVGQPYRPMPRRLHGRWHLSQFSAGHASHLEFERDDNNELFPRVMPEVMFLEINEAASRPRLLERPVRSDPFLRPGTNSKHYGFTAKALEAAPRTGGLRERLPI
jgi:hypothetical protein